jgi:hypothetical protein
VNKNEIVITVKSQNGNTWADAAFNLHQKIRLVIEQGLSKLMLDRNRTYEVLLDGRSLALDASFEDAGVTAGALLLVRTIGHTIDG